MDNPQYKSYDYALAAGEELTIHRVGNALRCLVADGPFKIGFGDRPLTDFEQGLGYSSAATFEKIRLLNPGAGTVNVTIAIAAGGVDDARLSLTGNVTAEIQGGETIQSGDALIPSAVATEIFAADATRLNVTISNLGAVPVYIGSAGVSLMQGIPIAPGNAATITTTAALYAFHNSAGALPIATFEVLK